MQFICSTTCFPGDPAGGFCVQIRGGGAWGFSGKDEGAVKLKKKSAKFSKNPILKKYQQNAHM